jgi:hypothetical protein
MNAAIGFDRDQAFYDTNTGLVRMAGDNDIARFR